MPAKDINVRRETARRCYRKKVAREKELSAKKLEEKLGAERMFREAGDRIRSESFNGWVSPRMVRDICKEYLSGFDLLSLEEVVREVEFYGYLWGVGEVGAYMGTAPFLRDEKAFEYFKKNVPKTQKLASKAELLILETLLRFIKKGHDPQVFDERYVS